MSQQAALGKIVLYKLSARDVESIRRTRHENSHLYGSPVSLGEVVPLVMTRIFDDQYGPGVTGVNGQLLLDGNHNEWVLSVVEGIEPGTWHWPSRS